jgi:tetratricopeptide (TPR) repeat protein
MKVFCLVSLYFCAVCILPAQGASRTEAFDPIRAAQDEALRRSETRMVMALNLRRAEEHRKAKRYDSAALLYEEAIRLARKLGNPKAIARDVTKAREGIVYSRLRLAKSLQDQDFFKEADEVAAKAQVYDPDNSRLRKFRKSNKEVRKAHIGRVPSREVQAAIESHGNKKATVLTLVRDGKAYLDLGQFGEAEKRLKEAVKLDPQSDVAYYYLRLILEAKYDREGRARDHNFQKRVIEIAETWNR